MKKNKRQIGYNWEEIVLNYYKQNWYVLKERNFATKQWEIDLILEKNQQIVFVEVKNIPNINDIFDYISQKKLKFLEKTIRYYIQKYKVTKDYRLDIVFVKNNEIYEIYKNVWIN